MEQRRVVHLWLTVAPMLLVTSACGGTSSSGSPTSVATAIEDRPASISGTILYESDDPFLRVYAREVTTGRVQWVRPDEGVQTYSITDLQPGTYVIVGWFYELGASGAYTSLDTVVAEGVD
jgi:hypothetical protein